MHSNKYKASITLGIAAIGFFMSSLFYDSFTGALLTACFGSAMIGGIADWFAVNALFRKPLGISYKTEILPRKREKIFNDIVDMVQNTLLSKENIKIQLKRYSIPHLLLRYLEQNEGKEDLKILLEKILQDSLQQINLVEILRENILKNQMVQAAIVPLLLQIIDFSRKKRYDDKIIAFIINELQKIFAQPEMKELITNILIDVQKSYEQDDELRKLAKHLLAQMGYTPDRLSGIIQDKLVFFLNDLKSANHPLMLKLKAKLIKLISELETDCELRIKVEEWIMTLIQKNIDEKFIRTLLSIPHATPQENNTLLRYITQQMDDFIDEFKNNSEKQQSVDDFIKKIIIDLLDSYHTQIGELVISSLNKYTNKSLVAMIESKVGDDLQMIRINGSLVGGIAGIVLFLLTFWV